MTRPARARRRGGFTIVEMAVTLAVLAIVLAFTLPKVVGSASFAEDQKAQATASGAMDAMARAFSGSRPQGRQTPFEAADCTDPAPVTTPAAPPPRLQKDRDHKLSNDELNAVAEGRYAPGDMGAYGYTRSAPAPVSPAGVPSNCPVFADPATLATGNGDVRFVTGDQPSTGSGTASVATWWTGSGWRLGAAVMAPQSHGTLASCWMVWRDFPTVASGSAVERYFVDTTVSTTSGVDCTGNGVQSWQADPALCKTADGSSQGADAGRSWRRPCGNYRS